MPVSARRLISNMIDDLEEERDELALQIHLGKQETKKQWERLGKKLEELNQRKEPLKESVGETSEDVWDAMRLVADEIKEGYQRIRKTLS
jgi:seryl-tRNA synthetase